MQKLNCILKILFNYYELTPQAKQIKTLHTIETKWVLEFVVSGQDTHTVCSHIGKVRESMFKIHVHCSDQCSKYFKILLVSKS